MIKVHDILIHTPTIEAQRLYRVIAIKLGGLHEEGIIELEPIGYISNYPIRIPHMMLDDMVKSGVVVVGWSLPNQELTGTEKPAPVQRVVGQPLEET